MTCMLVASYLAQSGYYEHLTGPQQCWADRWNRKYKRDLGTLHGIQDILEIVVDDDSNDGYEINRIYKQKLARLVAEEA